MPALPECGTLALKGPRLEESFHAPSRRQPSYITESPVPGLQTQRPPGVGQVYASEENYY